MSNLSEIHADPDGPADLAARRLSRWQILDMVLIHRSGRMKICRHTVTGRPCKPVQELIDAKIVAEGAGNYVMPGARFEAVLKALHRAGEIQSLEIPKPAWKQ